MITSYEWDIELVNAETDDIIDHDHANKLSEYGFRLLDPSVHSDVHHEKVFLRLVLVRDVGSQLEGITDRQWAYVNDDGTLPDHFDWCGGEIGAAIPQRFRTELAKWLGGAK